MEVIKMGQIPYDEMMKNHTLIKYIPEPEQEEPEIVDQIFRYPLKNPCSSAVIAPEFINSSIPSSDS